MELKINIKKLLPYIFASLILIPLLINLLFSNFKILVLLKEKPLDITVANITSNSAEIYIKSKNENIYTFEYKNTEDTGTYKSIDDVKIYKDNLSGGKLYLLTLEDLEPNKTYSYNIISNNNVWRDETQFKTKNIQDEIRLPDIKSGEDTSASFLLIKQTDRNVMLNTQYHGTWAFDSEGKEYTVQKYANYTSDTELANQLNSLIGKTYAAKGANCKTNVKINFSNNYSPTKSKALDILGRWTAACLKGHYGNECYEDLYCQSLKFGVDPGFAFAIWTNESGGSNYAYKPSVSDFGIIHSTIGTANFAGQSDWFLRRIAGNTTYLDSCGSHPSSTSKLTLWGAKFFQGRCSTSDTTQLEQGKQYITQIGEIYSWYTNQPLKWPFTIPVQPESSCDYNKATTNTTYNSCSSQGTPTTPTTPTTPATPTIPTTPTSETIQKIEIKKGTNFMEAIKVTNKSEVSISTAKDLIQESGNRIITVALLRNDTWSQIVKYEDGKINGKDFNLEPGETYLVIALEDLIIPAKGSTVTSKLDTKKLKGWNLISSSRLSSSSTSSKEILQTTTYNHISQLAQWENKQSIFKYTIRDLDNKIFGEDLKINTSKGIFIRISQ